MKGQFNSLIFILLGLVLLLGMLGVWKAVSNISSEGYEKGFFRWGVSEKLNDIIRTGIDEGKPESEPNFKDVLTTHYFITHRRFYDSDSAFRSAVNIEGAGIYEKNSVEYVLSYTGDSWKREGSKQMNGPLAFTGAGGSTPIEHRTIAVDPNLIKLGTRVYVYFGDCDLCKEWNGCYIAEDTGSAIKGEHIDLFVGVGKDGEKYDPAYGLPRKSNLWINKCER